MNAYTVVRFIVIASTLALLALFLLASWFWPDVIGHNDRNLAIALPIIIGVAMLVPLVINPMRKR